MEVGPFRDRVYRIVMAAAAAALWSTILVLLLGVVNSTGADTLLPAPQDNTLISPFDESIPKLQE